MHCFNIINYCSDKSENRNFGAIALKYMISTNNSIEKAQRRLLLRKLLIPLLLLFSNYVDSQIAFEEKALISGINHSYIVGQAAGGVSFVDFNDDGLDDLTFGTAHGEPIHFYRNTGNGFARNLPFVDNTSEQKQILWADYDNDGDKDLFVCAKDDVNRLYKNQGNMNFIDVTESSVLPLHKLQTYNACWADFNRDGWLDLYVCERVLGDRPSNRNFLYYNNANGTFTDVTEETQTQDGGKPPFSSSAVDVNNDNWPDIYIANDRDWGNTMFLNQNGEEFTDISETSHTNYEIDAMSIAIGDYNNDSWIDMYVSNSPAGNVLMKNNSGSSDTVSFSNEADAAGVGFNGTAWGSNFLDADNDGDLDLYVSGSSSGGSAISAAFFEQLSADSFTVIKNGFEGDTVISYANAVGDSNSDGYPDIAVMNFDGAKSFLFENHSQGYNYIKLKLEGIASNRDGIGAYIQLFADSSYQSYYTHSGVGFQGQNTLNHMFGLGTGEKFDSIIVEWPSGHIDKLMDVQPNLQVTLTEGSTTNGEIVIAEDVTIKEADFASSILHNDQGVHFQLSPIPADQYLTVSTFETYNKIEIYSSSGDKVLSKRFQAAGDLQMNVEHLPSGYYYLIAESKLGLRSSKSFVIIH